MVLLPNNPINLIISLSILLSISNSLDYHLYNKITNEVLNQHVSSIVVINDQNLAITKSNTTHTNISIFIGPNFNYKLKQLQVNSMISKPIPTLQGIFINNGRQILQKTNNNQSYQLMAFNISGNMMINKNNNYAIISKRNLCASLTFINLTIMKSGQYTYQQGQNCTFDYIGFVKQIGNNYVAYAARSKLYILNSTTLEVMGKLQQNQDKSQENNYNYLDTYYDQVSNNSVILVKGTGSNYKTYIKQGQGSYVVQGKFYNPTSQLYLTHLNKGISFQATNIYQWQDMGTNILAIDFNLTSTQYLKNKITIAISNNQQLFILKQKSNNILQFYTISPNYTIQNIFNITIIEQSITILSDKTSYFTQDNKYLFIQIYNDMDKIYSICKIDIQNKNYTYINIPDSNTVANCSAYTLLGKQTDCMVCICTVITINQTTNMEINQYYLQLRTVTTLQLINKLQLNVGINPRFKLLSYWKWKSSIFVLQVRGLPIMDDNCQSILYQVIGNQIIRILTNSNLSFHKVTPAGTYLLSLKSSQEETSQNYLNIYHAQNLSLSNKIPIQNGCKQQDNSLYSQADTILIQANFNLYKLDIYDFSTNNPDLWYQGSLFKQYYTKIIENYQADYLIFPNKKLYYIYFNGPIFIINNPTKLIYNLNKPPITNIFPMQKIQSKPQSYLYIKNTVPKCDYIFYLTNKTLNKFLYCQPYQEVEKYNLDPTDKYTFSAQKLILASSQRHLIIIYSINNNQIYTIQIRQIQRPQIKIFQYSVNYQIFNADYTIQGRFIYNQKNSIFSFMLDVRQYADIYSISSFRLFDTNSKGCIAFAGFLQNQQTKTRIIFKALSQQQTYTQWDTTQNIDLLKININCTKFVLYNKITNTLSVWSYIPNIINLFSQVIEGVIDVKFAGSEYIAVELATEIKMIKFIQQQNRQLVPVKLTNSNTNTKKKEQLGILFDTSNDGRIVVKSLDLQCIIIGQPTEQIQKQLTFCLPNIQYATGLSLAPSNSLSISTQLGNLYYLIPYPCPQTYMSFNLVCACRDHSVQINQRCQCKKNFFEENRNCICLESFILTDQGECICQNGFVQDRECKSCSFPCQTCTQSATNCLSYTTGFIVFIVGMCLIGVILIGGLAYMIRRRKLQKDLSQEKQELVDSIEN